MKALRMLLGAVAAAGLVLAAPGPAAHADPTPTEVEQQIDQQWEKIEPVIEQYNNVHNQLKTKRAQAAQLSKRLAPLQRQVDAAMSQVGGMAATAYMQGGPSAFDAMVLSGRPTGLADKLVYLDQYARHQRQEISGVAALRDRLAKDKQALDVLTASLTVRDRDLAATKKTIEQKIAALQEQRIRVYGAGGGVTGKLRTGPCPAQYTSDRGGRAAQKACSLIGRPYVFGAEGPSTFDCSGLTKVAWASVGVHLDHYTKDQWGSGQAVSRDELQPGDLVFFGSDVHHVGIYIGNGTMVHAPHTGDHVRMAPIDRGGSAIAGFRRPG